MFALTLIGGSAGFMNSSASSATGTLYVITRPGDPTIRLRATVLERNVDITSEWLGLRFGIGPMELAISPQPEPKSSPPVQKGGGSDDFKISIERLTSCAAPARQSLSARVS